MLIKYTPNEHVDTDGESDLLYSELYDYYEGKKWKEFDKEDSWYHGERMFQYDEEKKEDYVKAICDYPGEEILTIYKKQ